MKKLLFASTALTLLVAGPASAAPINSYPNASTPLTGSEASIGTQGAGTVQITTGSISTLANSPGVRAALPTASAPLTGNETIAATQGGSTVRLTTGAIANLTTPGLVSFATTTALLSQYPSGQAPPRTVFTQARDSNDTYNFGGGLFSYDSTIPVPAALTASIATVPGNTTLTVSSVGTGGSVVAGEFLTGSGVPAGEFILPFGTNSSTGTGASGTYALYLPATLSSESMVATEDNGGSVRIDAANHGFRFAAGQQVKADLFGAYQQNAAASNDAPLQNALSATYYAACFGAGAYSPNGVSSSTLWFNATNFTGYQFTQPKYIGAPGPNFACYNAPTLRGQSAAYGYGSVITGNLTSIGPALDWSGTGDFVLEDIAVRVAGADATVACFDGRIATLSGGQGTPNSSSLIDASCDANSSAASGSLAAAMFQDSDLLYVDPRSLFSGYRATNTTAGPYGPTIAVTIGNTLPYSPTTGALGIAQAGGASTITLASGASSATNAFAGLPIRVYPTNSSGICTGTFEPGYIVSYNGSTKVATVSEPWVTFTPTSSSCYAIYATGSAFQPYAGLSAADGATSYRMGGVYEGAIWHTGGDEVEFVSQPYLASFGSPSANFIEDDGDECISGAADLMGGLNVEAYGSNSNTVWARNGSIFVANLWGRFAGVDSDAVFRFTAADQSASICYPSGTPWGSVSLQSFDTYNQNLFDTGAAVANLFYRGATPSIGNVSSVGHCDTWVLYGNATLPCSEGTANGIAIVGSQGVLGATPGGVTVTSPNAVVPTASIIPTVTTSPTTGNSSQQRVEWDFPAHLLDNTALAYYLGLASDIDIDNNSVGNVSVVFDFVQGNATTAINSAVTVASDAIAHMHFMLNGYGSLVYNIISGTSVLASGIVSTSLVTSEAFEIKEFENAATGNATFKAGNDFLRTATN